MELKDYVADPLETAIEEVTKQNSNYRCFMDWQSSTSYSHEY